MESNPQIHSWNSIEYRLCIWPEKNPTEPADVQCKSINYFLSFTFLFSRRFPFHDTAFLLSPLHSLVSRLELSQSFSLVGNSGLAGKSQYRSSNNHYYWNEDNYLGMDFDEMPFVSSRLCWSDCWNLVWKWPRHYIKLFIPEMCLLYLHYFISNLIAVFMVVVLFNSFSCVHITTQTINRPKDMLFSIMFNIIEIVV